MAKNDSVNDRYAPPGIGSNDFEQIRFNEIEDEDLFWLNQGSGNSNPPYRKMNSKQGHNTKDGIVQNFGRNAVVYSRS